MNDSAQIYTTNFQQHKQLDLDISRISDNKNTRPQSGQNSQKEEEQPVAHQNPTQSIVQNIKIDKSTNNVYNFYNYNGTGQS